MIYRVLPGRTIRTSTGHILRGGDIADISDPAVMVMEHRLGVEPDEVKPMEKSWAEPDELND